MCGASAGFPENEKIEWIGKSLTQICTIFHVVFVLCYVMAC